MLIKIEKEFCAMKIINKTLNKNIDQVNPGELFFVKDEGIFMKIENETDGRNAVKIDNGKLHTLDRNTILQIINGELTV